MPIIAKKIEPSMSWEEIREAIQYGTVSNILSVGDEIVTIADGEEVIFVVTSIDDSAANSVTFGLKDCF